MKSKVLFYTNDKTTINNGTFLSNKFDVSMSDELPDVFDIMENYESVIFDTTTKGSMYNVLNRVYRLVTIALFTPNYDEKHIDNRVVLINNEYDSNALSKAINNLECVI